MQRNLINWNKRDYQRCFCHKYHTVWQAWDPGFSCTHTRLPDASNFQLDDAPDFYLSRKCIPDHFDASKEAKGAREVGGPICVAYCYKCVGIVFLLLQSLPDFLDFFTRFSFRPICIRPNFFWISFPVTSSIKKDKRHELFKFCQCCFAIDRPKNYENCFQSRYHPYLYGYEVVTVKFKTIGPFWKLTIQV